MTRYTRQVRRSRKSSQQPRRDINTPHSIFGVIVGTVLLLVLLLLASCNAEHAPAPAQLDQGGLILPAAGNGISLFAPPERADADSSGESQDVPKVQLPEDLIPHDIYEFGLDTDAPDEQIIVYKYREGQEDNIGLLLADYDPRRDGYFISWQGLTKATSLKTFQLYTQDVTGDRQQELVAMGTNNLGEQTLDIFKQEVNNTYGIQYHSILSIEADIEADIKVVERSEYYNSGERNGISFNVTAVNQDLESDNPLDMIRSIYTWRPGEGRYLLSYSENISGTRVEEDQLAELYSGNLDDYMRFIEGPWMNAAGNRLIYFSHKAEEIQLAIDDREINFLQTSSSSINFGRSIALNVKNENLESIKTRIIITILDLNTMQFRMNWVGPALNKTDEDWTGTYSRVSDPNNLISGGMEGQNHGKLLYPYNINGLYRSDNNWEMFFSAPQLTLRTQDEERTGSYVIYTLNNTTILEVNFLGSGGETPEKRQYVIQYQEEKDDKELRKIILMQAVRLNSYGTIPVNDEIIRLEQTIDLDEGQ